MIAVPVGTPGTASMWDVSTPNAARRRRYSCPWGSSPTLPTNRAAAPARAAATAWLAPFPPKRYSMSPDITVSPVRGCRSIGRWRSWLSEPNTTTLPITPPRVAAAGPAGRLQPRAAAGNRFLDGAAPRPERFSHEHVRRLRRPSGDRGALGHRRVRRRDDQPDDPRAGRPRAAGRARAVRVAHRPWRRRGLPPGARDDHRRDAPLRRRAARAGPGDRQGPRHTGRPRRRTPARRRRRPGPPHRRLPPPPGPAGTRPRPGRRRRVRWSDDRR